QAGGAVGEHLSRGRQLESAAAALDQSDVRFPLKQGELLRHRGRAVGQRLSDGAERSARAKLAEQAGSRPGRALAPHTAAGSLGGAGTQVAFALAYRHTAPHGPRVAVTSAFVAFAAATACFATIRLPLPVQAATVFGLLALASSRRQPAALSFRALARRP